MNLRATAIFRTCLTVCAILLGGCAADGEVDDAKPSEREVKMISKDPHSHARPDEIHVRAIDLSLDLDFDRRVLRGRAILHFARGPKATDHSPLAIDAKSLAIGVVRAGDGKSWRTVVPAVEKGDAYVGDGLIIPVEKDDDRVEITYETTDQGTGLQWLLPSQTAGKKMPFLFSQSQAIHARTWIPCQDSPGVRVTYTASVRAPAGMTAVMSAERLTDPSAPGEARFEMKRPIPPYLIALGAGELEFRALGRRTGVWAERPVIEQAAWEFADTEKMVDTVEGLFGPYRWGRYDLLVLPPSFPFGGMENPCMTFATPTVLAGDRSGVSLIAHELSHSWSGNLVTNATWRDFWLNEGFTVYLEQRIMEAIYGRERYDMEVALGMQDLADEMKDLEPLDQVLHVQLDGRDPDAGFTQVPYQKGAAFLRLLEHTFGRPVFDAFLTRWFDEHAFQSVTTEEFRGFLEKNLYSTDPAKARSIGTDEWIEAPGMPKNTPQTTVSAFAKVEAVAARLRAGESLAPADVLAMKKSYTTHEWLRLITALGDALPEPILAAIDHDFGFTASKNAEITCVWLELAVRSSYRPAVPRLEEFLTGQGRRKFLKPLYVALTDTPAMKPLALEIYRKARPGYHAIAVQTIDEIVGWK